MTLILLVQHLCNSKPFNFGILSIICCLKLKFKINKPISTSLLNLEEKWNFEWRGARVDEDIKWRKSDNLSMACCEGVYYKFDDLGYNRYNLLNKLNLSKRDNFQALTQTFCR